MLKKSLFLISIITQISGMQENYLPRDEVNLKIENNSNSIYALTFHSPYERNVTKTLFFQPKEERSVSIILPFSQRTNHNNYYCITALIKKIKMCGLLKKPVGHLSLCTIHKDNETITALAFIKIGKEAQELNHQLLVDDAKKYLLCFENQELNLSWINH